MGSKRWRLQMTARRTTLAGFCVGFVQMSGSGPTVYGGPPVTSLAKLEVIRPQGNLVDRCFSVRPKTLQAAQAMQVRYGSVA